MIDRKHFALRMYIQLWALANARRAKRVAREWVRNNCEARVATVIRYRERNREKVHAYQRERAKRPEVQRRAYMLKRRRRRANPECKLRDALRCRIYDALRKAKGKKADHSIRLLGFAHRSNLSSIWNRFSFPV